MNMQLQRKQAIMLLLAIVLAIASYWIPLPRQPVPAVESPELSKPVEKSLIVDSVVFARESATMWRFPITAVIPQTMQKNAMVQSEDRRPLSPWTARQMIDAREIGNSETLRLDKPAFAPTKDRERVVQ